VNVQVLLVIGDQAEIVAAAPPEERAEPERYAAEEIASAVGLDAVQLPGKQLVAAVGGDGRLSGWQLA
jgi:hypothetical protein